ncbi:hypothetical protein [Nonomuraea sp. NPDC002799]
MTVIVRRTLPSESVRRTRAIRSARSDAGQAEQGEHARGQQRLVTLAGAPDDLVDRRLGRDEEERPVHG